MWDPEPSYLNCPLAVPPGDLVRSVAWERDVLFSVNGLGGFLSGFYELKKKKNVFFFKDSFCDAPSHTSAASPQFPTIRSWAGKG